MIENLICKKVLSHFELRGHMITLIIILLTLLLSNLVYGHGREVHQYIVREAWKLVEHQVPDMITSDMKNWVGTNETNYCLNIVSGAWNEDQQDIIYMNCGWNFLTGCVMTSVNHFWDADAGEYSTFNWNGSHDNAKVKAEHMFYGTHHWYFGVIGNPDQYIWKLSHHDGLPNLYATGNFSRVGYWNILGQWINENPPYTSSFNTAYRKRVSYDILGRICHLLADMSVPAHVHNDAHSPLSQEGTDTYEEWVKNGGYSQYAFMDAYNQGGILFDVLNMHYPIRYLFYITNQYADFFPSDGDWTGKYWGDRDYNNSFTRNGQTDNYPMIDEIFNGLGTPPSSINSSNQASHLIPFVIRATASLLIQFAVLTNQISLSPISAYITGPDPVSQNGGELFTVHPSGGNGNYTYQWYQVENGINWRDRGTAQTMTLLSPLNGTFIDIYCYVRCGYEIEVIKTVAIDPGTGTCASCHGYFSAKQIANGFKYHNLEKDSKTPIKYQLSQNYPNPFNPSTVIRYAIPSPEFVTLKVYDMLGKEIQTLVSEYQTAGNYSVEFNGSNLANGIYMYTLQAGSFMASRKFLLIK